MRYLLAVSTENTEGSWGLMVAYVKPRPLQFPTRILKTPVGSTRLHFTYDVCCEDSDNLSDKVLVISRQGFSSAEYTVIEGTSTYFLKMGDSKFTKQLC